MNGCREHRRANGHHPYRNGEARRLVGRQDAFPVGRERRVFGVGIAQEARRRHAHRVQRTIARATRHAVFAAKTQRHAKVLQFEQFAVAVGVPLEFFEAGEELRAGVDVAAQHDDEGLTRPCAGAAPWCVQRKVVKQGGYHPRRLVGAFQ